MPLAVAREVIQIAPGEPGAWGLLAETPEGGTGLSALICSERAQLIGGKPEVFAPALVDALCSDPPLGASVVLQIAGMFADKAGNLGGTSPKDRVGREFVWALPLLKELAVRSGATAGDTAGVLAACARVYSAAELWSETETACAEALPALEPDAQASLQVLRSQALSQLSRRDEALAAARAAVQTAPGRADVQWNLARQLADAGMDREAQFVYKMLLQQIPKNRPEYARVGEEYARVLRRMQASPPEAAP